MAGRSRKNSAETVTRVLDVAERLAQVRGFNGFSYADISREVGVTTAALHYHFAAKADLGHALVVRYTDRFVDELARISDGGGSALEMLRQYVELYRRVLEGKRMCLCGMLAAEQQTLPAVVRDDLTVFFRINEEWLTGVLERGVAAGDVPAGIDAATAAQGIVGGLEGAMLLARLRNDVLVFDRAAERVLASLTR